MPFCLRSSLATASYCFWLFGMGLVCSSSTAASTTYTRLIRYYNHYMHTSHHLLRDDLPEQQGLHLHTDSNGFGRPKPVSHRHAPGEEVPPGGTTLLVAGVGIQRLAAKYPEGSSRSRQSERGAHKNVCSTPCSVCNRGRRRRVVFK